MIIPSEECHRYAGWHTRVPLSKRHTAADLVLHEIGDIVKGEWNAGVIVQQEAVAGSCVVVHHQLLHSA